MTLIVSDNGNDIMNECFIIFYFFIMNMNAFKIYILFCYIILLLWFFLLSICYLSDVYMNVQYECVNGLMMNVHQRNIAISKQRESYNWNSIC